MLKTIRMVLIGTFFYLAPISEAGEIAITIDDLPFVSPVHITHSQGLDIVRAINQALANEDIIATGFVVGKQVNWKTIRALNAFVNAGHDIGNHSWSHSDYGTQSADEFRAELQKTNRELRNRMGFVSLYRFPFLREGETEESKLAAAEILSENGYRNARVSIDNDEWRYNADYVRALEAGDEEAAQKIADNYLAHMQERTRYFDDLARQVIGRDIKHILLIHMNKINADHLPRLLAWYRDTGWSFITLNAAMADPAYSAPESYVGGRGISQIERLMAH